MLKKIELHDFQCYADAEITLSPGLNLFCGSSNAGKSSLVRALDWVLFNRPRRGTTELFRKGSSSCSALLEFDDCIVERFRSSVENGYRLFQEGTKSEFLSIGQEVPGAIEAALNIRPFDVAGDECFLNLAPQIDPPFLVTLTPVNMYRHIADITGLGHLGKALQLADRDALHLRQELQVLNEDWFAKWQILRDTWGLETQYESSCAIGEELDRLEEGEQESVWLSSWQQDWEALEDLEWVEEWSSELDLLLSQFELLREQESVLELLREWVSLPPMVLPSLQELEEAIEVLYWLWDYQRCEHGLELLEQKLGENEEELEALRRDYPICPVCQRPWGEEVE